MSPTLEVYKPGMIMCIDIKYRKYGVGVYELIISHVTGDMYVAVLLGTRGHKIESGTGGWEFGKVRSPITDIFCV